MPNTFNIIDQANIVLGDAKLLLPTGITNTPMRNFGKLSETSLQVEGSIVDLTSEMPEFTLKRYLMGQKATINAQSFEPLADGNLDLLAGSAASTVSAWAGVAPFSAYTAGDQTIVLTGDVSSSIAIGDYLKISESTTIEFFTVTKIEVSTNTTVTLPLGDTLQNSYTTGATVEREESQKTELGKYANLSSVTPGVLLFEEFQPQAGGTRKILSFLAHKMALPHSFELALASGEWIKSPIEVELLADATQTNGNLLGEFRIYDATLS